MQLGDARHNAARDTISPKQDILELIIAGNFVSYHNGDNRVAVSVIEVERRVVYMLAYTDEGQ